MLQRNSIALVGNSHIHTAWVWPWTETVDVVHRTFSTALQLMPEYPSYTFTQSVALYGAWMQEKYPDIFGEMKQRTREGRWEPVGGMWVEPDLNLPGGESLVRQLLVGKRFKTQMGTDVKVGWNPDSFGYNWQLPQIYARSGVPFFVTQKPTWNETNKLPLKLFRWQVPDGSRVLTYIPGAYDQNTEAPGMADDLAGAQKLIPGDTRFMRVYGVGDHGGAPTRVMLDQAERWMQPDAIFPKLTFATAESFFTGILPTLASPAQAPIWNYHTLATGDAHLPAVAEGAQPQVPVWNGELYLETHRGTYTSQAHHKSNMRRSEQQLLDAEALASLTSLDGQPYPTAALTEAWKKILFNQFHDLAAGSSIAAVYVDAQRDYDSVFSTAGNVHRQALAELAAHADTRAAAGTVPILIYNPLSWSRTDLVEADVQLSAPSPGGVEVLTPEGRPVASQVLSSDPATNRYHLLIHAENVPSVGFQILHVRPGKAPFTELKATSTTLENSTLRVTLDPTTGCITHVVDKASGFDSIASNGCANELQTFADNPKKYDAWNIDADALETMTPIRTADSVELVEQGPCARLSASSVTSAAALFAGHYPVRRHRARRGQERFRLAGDPHASQSGLPSRRLRTQRHLRDSLRCHRASHHRNNPVEKAKYEVPALRWADLGDGRHGLSLLNDSKYGYDARNVLRLSLLRSPTYPDPDTDHGRQRFTYALYPHSGTWQDARSVQEGTSLNAPLTAVQLSPAHRHTWNRPFLARRRHLQRHR